MDSRQKITVEWVGKAENDYRACMILLGAKDFPVDVLCFHCQQTVEKYLKAVLVFHQKRIRKTHDLEALLLECTELVPSLDGLMDGVLALEGFGPEARYPGRSDISFEDVPGLIEKTEAIRSAIRSWFEKAGVL
jgi:HEPN domain-containing protein